MSEAAPRYIFRPPISRIGVRPGRRPIDAGHVANLAVSFGEVGQRTPISLNLVADDDPARDRFTYWLNAGGHRLEAAKLLGWTELDAILDDDDALSAKIAEVDENLIRRNLNALEEAQALSVRQEAWAAKYPDRATTDEQGAVRAKRGRPTKLRHGAAISTMGFAADAAEATGLSKRTVERALAVYRGIPAGLQAQLLGTPVASNPGLLRQLAGMGDKDEQAKVAGVLVKGDAKTVAAAMAIAAGNAPAAPVPTPVDASLKAFRKVWADATPAARAAILHDLAGRSLPSGWIVREDSDA